MDKFNSSKGFKWYLFTGALMVLFLGTLAMTNNVSAKVCMDTIEYTCTAVETSGGTLADSWELCTSLCIIDNDYAYLDADPYFNCNLGFVSPKQLLGSGASIVEGGCSVSFNGSSMTVDMVDIIDNSILHLNCAPCNGCCPP
jgi:hypothetical protein